MAEEYNEMKSLISKIFVPAFVALSMKVAIMTKHQKVTLFSIIVSFVAGVGTTYLMSGLIMSFSDQWIPVLAAMTAISGEKIVNYLVYKFNIEGLIDDLIKKYKP